MENITFAQLDSLIIKFQDKLSGVEFFGNINADSQKPSHIEMSHNGRLTVIVNGFKFHFDASEVVKEYPEPIMGNLDAYTVIAGENRIRIVFRYKM